MVGHALTAGILLPAGVAAVAFGLLAWVRPLRAGVAGALGMAAAYTVGHGALLGWHGLLPLDVTHRLPHVALLAGVLAAFTVLRSPGWRARFAPAVAAPVAAWMLLDPLSAQLAMGRWVGVVVGLAAALAVVSGAWGASARDPHPLVTAGTLVLAAGTLGAASAATGSIVLAQLAGVVAASAAAMGLVAWIAGRILRVTVPLETMAATAGIVLGGCASLAVAYSATPLPPVALWALLPVALWGARAATRGRLRTLGAATVQLLVALLVGGAAATWAALPPAAPEGPDAPAPYDYGYGD
jgi:hypothetical protein